MPKSQTAVGVDIGAQSLKVVVLRKRGSHVAVLRAGSVELGDLAFIPDSERKDRRIAELLRSLLRRTRVRRTTVGAGLAGRDYFVKYLHVPPAPPQKLRRLIEYEVAEDPTAREREQTTDFWLLDLPTKSEEFTVLVPIARNDTLRRRLSLLKRAGLSTEGLTLDAVALFNSYEQALDEDIYNDKTTLLVDIGARHMDVVVQRNAKLMFVRNLSAGGLRFSEAVQEEFELPIKEAEELKLTQGAILPRHFDVAAEIDTDTPEARLSAALLEPAEAIYDTLQATIKYAQAQTRMPDLRIDGIVLSGRAAALRGLREFLAQRFHVPVDILDPFQGLDTSSLSSDQRSEVQRGAAGYTVATGLALRQLAEPHQRAITLLPEEVRRRREFLARDAFVYAAAAVFALAFGAMIYSSKAATERAERRFRTLDKQIDRASTEVGEFEARMERNAVLANRAEALKRLLDTGRRCAFSVTLFKKMTPEPLRVDKVATSTRQPLLSSRRGARLQEGELTTYLLIEGRVDETYQGKEVNEAQAKGFVDTFLTRLAPEDEAEGAGPPPEAEAGLDRLFERGEVVEYPKSESGQRTFKIKLYFTAPFYGVGREYMER
ncbi:MAG: type IV pilus assembly protein PilM [Candidatus Brocadiia bacterium]